MSMQLVLTTLLSQITITGVPREPSTAYIVPFAAIDPTKSKARAITVKIELDLVKAQPGKWPNFGREELGQPDPSTLPHADSAPTAPTTALPDTTKHKAPAYPTSAKSGPKDWEHIEAEEEEEEGNVDHFFKKLYGGATPEQQRAMKKSFMESNGTSLSTNWDEVGKGPVETTPPDGMVAKKWES